MTKDELIVNQQLKIEEYKSLLCEVINIKHKLHGMFFSIGQPMNDNFLEFNRDQLKWCCQVDKLIKQLPGEY